MSASPATIDRLAKVILHQEFAPRWMLFYDNTGATPIALGLSALNPREPAPMVLVTITPSDVVLHPEETIKVRGGFPICTLQELPPAAQVQLQTYYSNLLHGYSQGNAAEACKVLDDIMRGVL